MEEKDIRMLCKYGAKCYQKNKDHKRKYKHLEESTGIDSFEPLSKKEKTEDENSRVEQVIEKKKEDKNEEPLIVNSLSPLSSAEVIKENYLVDMPKDFYDFWKLCENINSEKPTDAFKCAGLTLCGPFDILSGKIEKSTDAAAWLCHWRYYYDPPEFQTVIAGSEDEYHIGYYRDVPSDLPVLVASMSNNRPGWISTSGENLFNAVISYLKSCKKEKDVFKQSEIQQLIKSTEAFSEENNYSLEPSNMKARSKKVVAKTFHGAGIVVPVCKETDVGYREIPETNAALKKMFKKIKDSSDITREANFEALHELMTQVQFANDEGDFGMGLELAVDLFTFGGEEFHSTILHLLTVSYELLKRSDFTKIIKAHLADRRKGSEMSRI